MGMSKITFQIGTMQFFIETCMPAPLCIARNIICISVRTSICIGYNMPLALAEMLRDYNDRVERIIQSRYTSKSHMHSSYSD